MKKFNLEKFLESYKTLFGKLTKQQTISLEFLSKKLMTTDRIDTTAKAGYVLATIKWETADTFQPVSEYGSQQYLMSKKYYPFIGRGYVQLTWLENYKKFGDALGKDLVSNPTLANDPETAWKILVMGMTDDFGSQDPNFTKYTLEDFFNDKEEDFLNARKIINPGDKKTYQPIAESAIKFKKCLDESLIPEEPTEVDLTRKEPYTVMEQDG